MKKKSKGAAREEQLSYRPQPAWTRWDQPTRTAALRYAGEYGAFLDRGKTAREAVAQAVKLAKREGFADFTAGGSVRGAGRKYYWVNRRTAAAFVLTGRRPLTDGVNIIAAHVDAPRLDLKVQPLFEDSGLALLRTHYYGGIKKYQWMNVPLALHGTVVRGDGTKLNLCVGEEPGEPQFVIADLEPHLAYKRQNEKKLRDAIAGEEMHLLAGALPVDDKAVKQRVKLGVLELLQRRYGMTEEDFISAELEAVPAANTADIGWDRALTGGYGQDDRACVYAALRALADCRATGQTAVVLLFDKEETGSEGNTGAKSRFLQELAEELLRRGGSKDLPGDLNRLWRNSRAISGDVTGAVSPAFKDVHDLQNACRLGYGLALAKFTGSGGKSGSSDASAEFVGAVRQLLNAAGVPWQAGEHGKVDEGGGGTIAKFLAQYGMEVIDAGPGVLGMHSPWEITHKADLYATYLGYRAFLKKSW